MVQQCARLFSLKKRKEANEAKLKPRCERMEMDWSAPLVPAELIESMWELGTG
jgi:hypothetical protein